MDIIDIVRKDHRYFEELLSRLLKQDLPSQKRRIFDQFQRAINAHSRAEERILYPCVKEYKPSIIKDSRREHRRVDGMLLKLSIMDPNNTRFDQRVREMRDAMRHHIHEEEGPGGVLSVLKRETNEQERDEMGRELNAYKRKAKIPMLMRVGRKIGKVVRRLKAG